MRIVIGEDSALFREGLARLLEDAGHEVAAKADDAPSLVAAVEAQQPDLAVIDVRMPPDRTDDGARAARELRDRMPELGIVLLSQHIETRHSVELVAGGHFGYLLKDRVFDVDDFLDALRRVAAGGSALDPEVVTTLLGPQRADPLALLTPREREVLALMAEGRTNVGIATRLWLTDRTVETHVGSIMAKLGLHESVEEHRRVLAVLTFLGVRQDVERPSRRPAAGLGCRHGHRSRAAGVHPRRPHALPREGTSLSGRVRADAARVALRRRLPDDRAGDRAQPRRRRGPPRAEEHARYSRRSPTRTSRPSSASSTSRSTCPRAGSRARRLAASRRASEQPERRREQGHRGRRAHGDDRHPADPRRRAPQPGER